MHAHRLRADEELPGDLAVGPSVRHEREDLLLPRAQLRRVLRRPRAAVGDRGARASQRPEDPREELVLVHGPRQVIVGARQQTGDAVARRAFARDEDHGQRVAVGEVQLPHQIETTRRPGKVDLDDRQHRPLVERGARELGALDGVRDEAQAPHDR